MDLHIDVAAAVLDEARRILVFTGAGVSTESGIPDFRGPDGVWTKVDPAEFTIERYLHSAETRRRSWAMWSASPMRGAAPNDAHYAIADLHRSGRVIGCVTQNIDGLHQAAGMSEESVVELHGNAKHTACRDCEAQWPTEEIFGWVAAGDEDPHCPHCGGIIKMTTVSFGEMMPQREMITAHGWADHADAVIAVGTTLGVYPAANVPLIAAERGVPYIIINKGPTEHDHLATVRIDQAAAAAMRGIVQQLIA